MEYLTPDDYKKAEANGIERMTVYNRFYQYGWTKERSITKAPYRPGEDDHPRRVYPKKYYEQAEKNGIKPDTFRDRVQKGMSMEEASTLPSKKYRKHPDNYKEALMANGISIGTYQRRLRNGWSMEDAMNTPPMTKAEAARIGLRNRYQVGGSQG